MLCCAILTFGAAMEAEHSTVMKKSGAAGFIYSNRLNFAVLFAYLLISIVIFWPVSTNITTTVAGVGGDPYQSMWNLWWVGYSTFTLHQSFWSTSLVFWPIGANLIYQTLSPIGAFLVYPFQAVGPAFAYNVLFFIGIILSGFGMFVLSDYIVKNKYAAFIAGIIFTFSAFHIAQSYGHLDYANVEWVPLSIYFFLRILNKDYFSGKYGRYLTAVALSAVFILCTFMGDIEQGIILVMTMILIAVVYAVNKSSRSKVLSREFLYLMIIFVAVTFVLGSWAFIPILAGFSGSAVNQLNTVPYNMIWSDDLLSFFLPSYYNGVFNGLTQSYINIYHLDIGETTSYIGYTVLALAAYGVYKMRKPAYLWVILGIVFFLLALGPDIMVNYVITGIPGPYLLLKFLPIVNILREPGRFDLVVSIAAAVLAAFGSKMLFEAISKNRPVNANHTMLAVTAIISILILLETAAPPLSGSLAGHITTNAYVSQFYMQLGKLHGNFSVLELPVQVNQNSTLPGLYPGEAMFTTVFTHKPIIGGYLTRENNSENLTLYNIPIISAATSLEAGGAFGYLSVVNENYTNQTLLALYLYNTTIVTLNENAYNATALHRIGYYLEGVFGNPIYDYSNDSVIAWSTVNAIDSNVFRSYVGFPGALYWNESVYNIGNSNATLWTPVSGGYIVVYPPYLNGSSSNSQEVNTTVTVDALSVGGSSLLNVEQLTANGTAETVAELNISGGLKNYTFTTKLIPGNYGNIMSFAINQSIVHSNVGISGITFSLAKNS